MTNSRQSKMRSDLAVFIFALASFTGTISGHEHHKQHSHFCEGGGYTLYCPMNQTLTIERAWYGRIAHDRKSCARNGNMLGNTTALEPDLDEDCGSSILDSKSSWCEHSDKGGCTIKVQNLGPAVDQVKCPEDANKYLYLEYECLGDSGAGVSLETNIVLFALLNIIVSCFCWW